MKFCGKCKLTKTEDEFAFKNKEQGKRASVCKLCHCKYAKKHYENNTAKYLAKAAKHSSRYCERNHRLIAEYLLDHPCVDCGEKDIRTLDFDHTDPTIKTNNISNMIAYGSWEVIETEMKKCEIRCANCHRKKTADQRETYKAIFHKNHGTVR